jgi:NAD(P)-dependent dehydrogenase (short-subunit alcohol dehydrogenase family)
MGDLFIGKRVLVTGSTRGVGHAAACRFLDAGAHVFIHGRVEPAVALVATALDARFPGRVEGHAAQLTDCDAIDRLAHLVGDIDILVNCAGIFEDVPIVDADEDHWNRTIAVNLTAAWRLSRALLDGLVRRQGTVVNVGSDAALLGYAGSIAYCASKGALIGLTRALATEMAPQLRAICVCPGPIDTDMMRDSIASQPDPTAARSQWASYPLLQRIAAPAEIAEAILFAASPKCAFQTGSVIMVDGGATAGRRLP